MCYTYVIMVDDNVFSYVMAYVILKMGVLLGNTVYASQNVVIVPSSCHSYAKKVIPQKIK